MKQFFASRLALLCCRQSNRTVLFQKHSRSLQWSNSQFYFKTTKSNWLNILCDSTAVPVYLQGQMKKNACSFCFCKFIISIFNFLRPFTGSTLKSPILTWNSWGRLWHASLEFCTPKFSILHRLLLINFSFVIWLLNLSYTTTTSTTITILYIILYHYASFSTLKLTDLDLSVLIIMNFLLNLPWSIKLT